MFGIFGGLFVRDLFAGDMFGVFTGEAGGAFFADELVEARRLRSGHGCVFGRLGVVGLFGCGHWFTRWGLMVDEFQISEFEI